MTDKSFLVTLWHVNPMYVFYVWMWMYVSVTVYKSICERECV